jgi:hypothetical protein
LYLTLYIQDDLGYGPFAAGLRFLPLTLMAFVVAPIAGKLTVRVRIRFLMSIGLFLVAVACLLMTLISSSSTWGILLPGFLVAGVGIGLVNPTLASSAVSVVPPERSGMASGANSTFRQVGIATGIAALGAVFQSQIVSKTTAALESSAAGRLVLAHGSGQLRGALTAGQVHAATNAIPVAAARQALLDAYRVGFASTIDHLMIIGAVVAFVGALGSLLLIRQRDFVLSQGPPASGHAAEPSPAVAA